MTSSAEIPSAPIPSSHRPNQRSGSLPSRTARPPRTPPIASPSMNVASMEESACVVLPRTTESARVQTTSYESAAAPESANAARTARRGAAARWEATRGRGCMGAGSVPKSRGGVCRTGARGAHLRYTRRDGRRDRGRRGDRADDRPPARSRREGRHRPRARPAGGRPREDVPVRRDVLRRRAAPLPHRGRARGRVRGRGDRAGAARDPPGERGPRLRRAPLLAAPRGRAALVAAAPPRPLRRRRAPARAPRRRLVRGRDRPALRADAVRELLRAVHAPVPRPGSGGRAPRLGPRRRRSRGDRPARRGVRPALAPPRRAPSRRDELPVPEVRRGTLRGGARGGGHRARGDHPPGRRRRRARGRRPAGRLRRRRGPPGPVRRRDLDRADRARAAAARRGPALARVPLDRPVQPGGPPARPPAAPVDLLRRRRVLRPHLAPDRLLARGRPAGVIDDLVAAGALARGGDVGEVHLERVADTYPVYTIGHREELRRALRDVSRWENLLVAGRCGRFWYNNMDHSIAQGLAIAREIQAGRALSDVDVGEREFWTQRSA